MKTSTIDAYIAACPASVHGTLETIRQTIHAAAPHAEETISYDMPTFDLNGKHLVFFAAWKHHVSVYPVPAGDHALRQAMARYKQAKGSIRFPLEQPIPYDLVGELVRFLIQEKPGEDLR